MENHKIYIQRCFDLARLGAGKVAPNPMVGAVLVYQNRIIGEGWHKKYGEAHAEVNALASVSEENRKYISDSTLYVSLEPCCFFGKTPACTKLILENQIKKVVISCLDDTQEVSGKGVEILREKGLEVLTGVLEKEGRILSRYRNTFVTHKRPYIILKYAKSKDGFFSKKSEQIWITNPLTKRLVHKWRGESDAILVGTETARVDNPQLTNRLFFGKNPIRIVIDRNLKLNQNLNLFDQMEPTWFIHEKELVTENSSRNIQFFKISFDENFIQNLLKIAFSNRIMTMIIEGGAYTIQQFIDKNLWDEARVLTGSRILHNGIQAPDIAGIESNRLKIGGDQLTILKNNSHFR